MATNTHFTIQTLVSPTSWYHQKQWRVTDAGDQERGHALRLSLAHLAMYPTTDLVGDPMLDVQEANHRLALHEMIEELGRNDVIALSRFVRLLAVTPLDSSLFDYQQKRGEAFAEWFFKNHKANSTEEVL